LAQLLTRCDTSPIASLRDRNVQSAADLCERDIRDAVTPGDLRHRLRPDLGIQLISIECVTVCHAGTLTGRERFWRDR